jgi:hypothetical protein
MITMRERRAIDMVVAVLNLRLQDDDLATVMAVDLVVALRAGGCSVVPMEGRKAAERGWRQFRGRHCSIEG